MKYVEIIMAHRLLYNENECKPEYPFFSSIHCMVEEKTSKSMSLKIWLSNLKINSEAA